MNGAPGGRRGGGAGVAAGWGSMRSLGLAPRRLARAVVAGTIGAASGIGLLATSGWLITRAAGRPPVFVLSVAIGLVQAFALGRGIARYLERLAVHDVSLELLGRLRLRLFDMLEPLVPGGLGSGGSGEVLSGFVSDAEIIATAFAKRVTTAIDLVASIVLGTAVALVVEPGVGAVLLAGALAMAVVATVAARLGRAGAEREAAARAELADSVIDTMRVARELVAFGREDLVSARLAEVRRRSNSGAARRALATGIGRAGATFIATAAVALVVATGIAAHDAGHLSGVMLAVEVFVALAVYDQFAVLPPVLADLGAGRSAAHRLSALGALPAPVVEPDLDAGPPEGAAEIAFDRVRVTHGATVALDGLSLRLPPGKRVALVGRSGSGKTSALHALLHFVPCTSGRASIGGVDVARITRAGIARHIGWVDDVTHVFAASLGDNLRIADTEATESSCVAALAAVGLAAWLASLPEGLETRLGAGGRPMSAGERQRLGLARALLAGGDTLALDEPTAHIDPTSSAGVLDELVGATGSKTVLVISHEPGLERLVDEIVTLEGGCVVDRQATRRDPAAGRPPGGAGASPDH